MDKMMGKRSKQFLDCPPYAYCCFGHDGVTSEMVKRDRKGQRARERRNWQREVLDSRY